MRDLLNLIRWMLLGRFRSKASLEAEILALRHQLNVLRRTSPRRPVFSNFDRMIFVCLYRIAPRILDAITIVEPETVIRWHRAGFRSFWRWKSSRRAGRPSVPPEISATDPGDEPGQSALGRSPHPWRAPQARHRRRPDLSRQVHGAAKTTSLARLENVPPQPYRRDRLNRPLRGSDDLIQVIVRHSKRAKANHRSPITRSAYAIRPPPQWNEVFGTHRGPTREKIILTAAI